MRGLLTYVAWKDSLPAPTQVMLVNERSHVSLTWGSSSISEASCLETSRVATRGPIRPSLKSLHWGQFHSLGPSPDPCRSLPQVLELREEESHVLLLLRLLGHGENLGMSLTGLGHPGPQTPMTAAALEPYLSGRLQRRRTARS